MPGLANPLLQDLGVELVAWRQGLCELELVVAERHLNRRGQLQGGVTATLLDAACGYAGLLQAGSQDGTVAATAQGSFKRARAESGSGVESASC
jgi:uncharacterized protein (TIGR00369 family)